MSQKIRHITFVVPTHNRRDELLRCLESIERLASGFPILVVDDGGTDDTCQTLAEQFPKVAYHHYQINRGPAYARNRALSLVDTQYIAFLDSDAVITAGWIDAMMSNTAPDTILAGCVLQPDGSIEWGPRKTMFWGGSIPCLQRDANVASSNNMIVPVVAARSIGGFSEELPIYFEDSYFCISARRKGYKVRYVDKATIIHYHDSRPDSKRLEHLLRNRTYVMVRDSRYPVSMTMVQIAVGIVDIVFTHMKRSSFFSKPPLKQLIRGIIDAWLQRVEVKKGYNG